LTKRCLILSLTGQYVVAIFIALSQFIEPYSDQEVAAILKDRAAKDRPAEQWEIDAYNLKPLNPSQLSALIGDNAAFVKYLRATCVRALSSTQPVKAIERGDLLALDLDLLLGETLDDQKIKHYQSRVLKSESGFSIEELKDLVYTICNPETPETKYVEKLTALPLKEGIKYYLEHFNKLPKISSVADLPKLTEMSFVSDSSGAVVGEISETEVNTNKQVVKRNRRILPKDPIPVIMKKALVAVEDARFWNFKPKGSEAYEGHLGVDFAGLLRAMVSSSQGELQGASTITMQLAKNLLLYKDVFTEHFQGKRSLLRKLKEYILVKRLEDALSKDQILDWYLNTIDFGRKSQGIAMAAKSYFGKDLKDLKKIEDVAFLAALPKAPSSLDPADNFDDAIERRNKVINAMRKSKFITSKEKTAAKAETINFIPKPVESSAMGYASFYISAVEKQLKEWLSSKNEERSSAHEVEVPINHEYQKWAVESLQRGLLDIERRKGTLVVKPNFDQLPNIREAMVKLAKEKEIEDVDQVYKEAFAKVKNQYPDGGLFKLGLVISDSKFELKDGTEVSRHSKDTKRKKIVDGEKKPLEKWDVVLLQPIIENDKLHYRVASYTEVQGAIVVLDNKTGAILATSGGFSIGAGRINQGVEGNKSFSPRQPGSTVKPFLYFHAMMKGLSPSTVVSNRNFKLPERKIGGERICKKWNFTGSSKEASSYTLRGGLEQSKNRTTINAFANSIGVSARSDYKDYSDVLAGGIDEVLFRMQRFGLYKGLEHACYPILLGTNEVSVVDLAAAYATIANQGTYKVPYTIKKATRGNTSFNPFKQSQAASALLQAGGLVQSEEKFNLFRLRTFMQGVVKRGTAKKMKDWYKIIAGKTGTTNDNRDAWFAGFNKEITVVVRVGYLRKKFLGFEYDGASAALPIFKDFMEHYYAAHPEKLKDEFSLNPDKGIRAYVEPETGFEISDEFQSDYEHYTGTKDTIQGVEEYFLDQSTLNKSVRPYEIGSIAAGRFFFNNLGDGYKKHYSAEYEDKKRTIEENQLYKDYQEDFKNFDQYCRENKIEYPDHKDVIETCAKAENLKKEIEKMVGSFENYYLQTLGFE